MAPCKPTLYGYLRVSTSTQDVDNQRLSVFDLAGKQGVVIDRWVEVEASSRKSAEDRRLVELFEMLAPGDSLYVSELSRLGRSLTQIVKLVDELIQREVRLHVVKEGIHIKGEMDMGTKAQVGLFAILSELERDLISQRTREGLARARAQGKRLGRPKGPGKSKLDGKEAQIAEFLAKGVSKASLAKIFDVAWPTMDHFIKTRRLDAPAQRKHTRGTA